jgi:hypothetical protein
MPHGTATPMWLLTSQQSASRSSMLRALTPGPAPCGERGGCLAGGVREAVGDWRSTKAACAGWDTTVP